MHSPAEHSDSGEKFRLDSIHADKSIKKRLYANRQIITMYD